MTPQSTIALYLLMAFSGFSAIGIWVTQMSASADVIEWDEERTGQRQEGAYGGITSMSIKMAIAISLLMVGPVLSWVGYKPGGGGITPAAGEQSARTIRTRPCRNLPAKRVGLLALPNHPRKSSRDARPPGRKKRRRRSRKIKSHRVTSSPPPMSEEADARPRASGGGPNLQRFRMCSAADNRGAKCPPP